MSAPPHRLLTLLLLFVIGSGGGVWAATLSISCGAVGMELNLCRQAVDAWARQTGNQVKVVATPNSATERFALYQQILASHSSDIDIFQIDVVWPGMLAPHLEDLSQYIGTDVTKQYFPSLVANNSVPDNNGKARLVAIPWFTNAGVLYYRKDLLEKYHAQPPTTWQQLTDIARSIQQAEREAGNPRMVGFVFQAKGYEGLTCDALEWIDSFGGGALVDAEGRVTIDNPRAVTALKLAKSWIGDIAPRGVLNYDEEQSRGVFQSGNAVFMRNWPYAWALGNAEDSPVRGRIGVVAVPAGGPDGHPSGVLGGWQLAVSRYSKHPELAADLVRHLTSYAEQKHRAVNGSYNPAIPALYRDPDVLAAVPFFGTLYPTFARAVARPSRITGARYARVSAEFYYTVHDVLSGKVEAAPALAAAAQADPAFTRRAMVNDMRTHGSRLMRQRERYAWLFLLPMLLVLALVAGWPLLKTIAYGFTNASLIDPASARFIGFDNFTYLLLDSNWWSAVWNTVVFAIVSVSLETVLGMAIALALNAQFAGRGALRAAVLIPWAIPTVVPAQMWSWMFNDVFGVINHMLLATGLIAQPVAWLASPDTALLSIILVDVWKTTPFMALLLLAGLQMLPRECFESARVDGVPPLKVFYHISLPLMRPALTVAIIFRLLDALRMFDLVYVMSGNSRDTMSMSVYARQQLVDFGDLGFGSAAATLIFAIIALFSVVYLTLMHYSGTRLEGGAE